MPKGTDQMSIIDNFIEYYTKNLDYYREAARICAQICETSMEQMGIRTIVTSRAKKPQRLKDKLEKRDLVKNYSSFDEIYEDIADLSGVRIALYFPGDLYKVQQLIEANFQVKEYKVFPEPSQMQETQENEYKKRFSGYWATHYRVYLKEKDLPEGAKQYSGILFEIQVASALMHAWAEVEHDLVYKPFSGELSYEEYQILDELNGLVLAGEIALQRLQKAMKNRVSQVGTEFGNHYELAMFLYNKLGYQTEGVHKDIVLGRVDLLFDCIRSTGYDKPEALKELLTDIDTDSRKGPVVDQILEKLREFNPMLYENYRNVKQNEELKYQLDTLNMNRENGNRQGEANTLANIGFIYVSREKYEEAIGYFEQAIKINHEIGGIQGEANQLLNLGSAYRLKGDPEKALTYCNQALQLHKQISYKQGQANALGMIGNICTDSLNYAEAMDYYNEALTIYQETNYRFGEVTQLNNLGLLSVKQGDNAKAIEYFTKTLEVCKDCDYKQGEGDALYHIGNIYMNDGQIKEAIKYYERAYACQEAAGNQKNKVSILISLGKARTQKGSSAEAQRDFKEALSLSNSIEYTAGIEEAQKYISKVHNLEIMDDIG